MKEFFAKYPDAGAGARAREQALETVQNNIKWLSTNKPDLEHWLKENGFIVLNLKISLGCLSDQVATIMLYVQIFILFCGNTTILGSFLNNCTWSNSCFSYIIFKKCKLIVPIVKAMNTLSIFTVIAVVLVHNWYIQITIFCLMKIFKSYTNAICILNYITL